MNQKSVASPHEASTQQLHDIFHRLRAHAPEAGQATAAQRRQTLLKLKNCVIHHRPQIQEALLRDFGKSSRETDFSEILTVTTEITKTVSELRRWMRPYRVPTPVTLIGNRSEIIWQPKGVVLIISPWNFPINLTLTPLVSAIAAGNTVCIKPSEFTPHSNRVIETILKEVFTPDEVTIVQGGVETGSSLLDLPFHHIFFTGSPRVGQIVMAKAARHLTSITLELGGKSPAIVDESADIVLAANRIIWSKCYNGGQICIAPDMVWVHESKLDAFLFHAKQAIHQFYGENPQESPDYTRIIHDHHFLRLKAMLDQAAELGARIEAGGQTDQADRYIAPTLLTHIPKDCALMHEEIFGPLLPILTYRKKEDIISVLADFPTPLALYIFSRKRSTQQWFLRQTRAGNSAVNTALAQFFNSNLPFGGEQNSGFGKTHGYFGFQAFSNARSVIHQPYRWSAVDLVQPPFNSLTRLLANFFIRWF
ncbi:MAG: aldehyde dehydrogenase family protein [Saprospiraceae bacterium]|nr:aldehyde dehydrogenase family protein [Saprospiraceae bacterium]